MKKSIIPIIAAAIILASCNNSAVQKPDNLIEKDKMTDVLYDVAVIQAINSAAQGSTSVKQVDMKGYLKKKYGIDSLTFVQNHKYYASDLDEYQKMQNEIKERLTRQTVNVAAAPPALSKS